MLFEIVVFVAVLICFFLLLIKDELKQIKNVKKDTLLFVHSYINLYTSSNKTRLKIVKDNFVSRRVLKFHLFWKNKK